MSVFLTPGTFSEAEKLLGLSQTTLADHIKTLLNDHLLDQQGRNYFLSEKGIKGLDDLKTQVSRLESNWKAQTQYPELYRHHTLAPASGNVGKAQYTSFCDIWGQTQPPEIPKKALDEAVKTLLNSVPSEGLGTLKCSITISFRNAS